VLVGLVTTVLTAVTTYLLLDRNHAEELGSGSRAVSDALRGDHAVGPATWLVLGALAAAYVVRRTTQGLADRVRR
jgi:hypothetical protein